MSENNLPEEYIINLESADDLQKIADTGIINLDIIGNPFDAYEYPTPAVINDIRLISFSLELYSGLPEYSLDEWLGLWNERD